MYFCRFVGFWGAVPGGFPGGTPGRPPGAPIATNHAVYVFRSFLWDSKAAGSGGGIAGGRCRKWPRLNTNPDGFDFARANYGPSHPDPDL